MEVFQELPVGPATTALVPARSGQESRGPPATYTGTVPVPYLYPAPRPPAATPRAVQRRERAISLPAQKANFAAYHAAGKRGDGVGLRVDHR